MNIYPVNKARLAGIWYLLLVFTAPFSQLYIPAKLIVRSDAAATASHILAHETLFRIGIVASLFTSVIFLMVALALYRLLEEVNRSRAQLMVVLVVVSVAVGFLNTLNDIGALLLFRGGDFLLAFDKPQRDALGMLFLRLHSHGEYINEIFWGLWLLPFGLLVLRSGFLPRFIGVWLILNGLAYVALSITAVTTPTLYGFAFKTATPFLLGELAIVLWLLIKGADPRAKTHDLPNEKFNIA